MFQLVYQRRRGSTKDYTFRGKATEQNHSIALPLQYGDQQLVLWVRHAPPRKVPAQVQEFKTSGAWSLLGLVREFLVQPRATSRRIRRRKVMEMAMLLMGGLARRTTTRASALVPDRSRRLSALLASSEHCRTVRW